MNTQEKIQSLLKALQPHYKKRDATICITPTCTNYGNDLDMIYDSIGNNSTECWKLHILICNINCEGSEVDILVDALKYLIADNNS